MTMIIFVFFKVNRRLFGIDETLLLTPLDRKLKKAESHERFDGITQ